MNAEQKIWLIAAALLIKGYARKDPVHRYYGITGNGPNGPEYKMVRSVGEARQWARQMIAKWKTFDEAKWNNWREARKHMWADMERLGGAMGEVPRGGFDKFIKQFEECDCDE